MIEPPKPKSDRGGIPLRLALPLAVACLPFLVLAAEPDWWAAHGVKTSAPANDYAAVNQGQVKNVFTAACAELLTRLPQGLGDTNSSQGTGSRLTAILDQWSTLQPDGRRVPSPGPATNDYAAVNLGQLKALATPMYDRLMEVGYTNHYPWEPAPGDVNATPRPRNDYAMANIGQAKNLFSFDFSNYSWSETTLPDWWTMNFFGTTATNVDPDACPSLDGISNYSKYRNGLNPLLSAVGSTPALVMVTGGDQRGEPGTIAPDPLDVRVTAGDPSTAVTFTVISGDALLCSSTGSADAASTLQVSATTSSLDASGTPFTVARAYVLLPESPQRCVIQIAAATSGGTACLYTTAVAAQMDLAPPTALTVATTSASSVALSWTPSDDTQPTTLQFSTDFGATWQNLGCIAAGLATTPVGGIAPGQTIYFRAFTGGCAPAAVSSALVIPSLKNASAAAAANQGPGPGGPAGSVGAAGSALPALNYAVIDLSGSAGRPILDIALDDQNNAACFYKVNDQPERGEYDLVNGGLVEKPPVDRQFCIYKFKNGAVTGPFSLLLDHKYLAWGGFISPPPDFVEADAYEDSGQNQCDYGGLIRPDGSLIFQRDKGSCAFVISILENPFPDESDPSIDVFAYGFSIPVVYPLGSGPGVELNPLPDLLDDYTGTSIVWPDPLTEEALADIIASQPQNGFENDAVTLWGAVAQGYFGQYSIQKGNPPGSPILTSGTSGLFVTSPFGTQMFTHFEPFAMNAQGWTLGNNTGSDYNPAISKPGQENSVNFPSEVALYAINDQNEVIGYRTEQPGGPPSAGFLWTAQKGTQDLTALFKPGISGTFTYVCPYLISNKDAKNRMNIAFGAYYTPPAATGTAAWGAFLLSYPSGDVYQMNLPGGNLRSMNASGVIAATGPVVSDTTGTFHGLLLLPVEIKFTPNIGKVHLIGDLGKYGQPDRYATGTFQASTNPSKAFSVVTISSGSTGWSCNTVDGNISSDGGGFIVEATRLVQGFSYRFPVTIHAAGTSTNNTSGAIICVMRPGGDNYMNGFGNIDSPFSQTRTYSISIVADSSGIALLAQSKPSVTAQGCGCASETVGIKIELTNE